VVVNQPNWSAEHLVLALRIEQAGGDDRSACATGARDAASWLPQEWHSVATKPQLPDRHPGRGVAELDVALGVLTQPDRDCPPTELLAVAPPQNRESGARRVRPRTAGIGEVSYGDPYQPHRV